MKINIIKQFVHLREELIKEKADLENKLQLINSALGKPEVAEASNKTSKRRGRPASSKRKGRMVGKTVASGARKQKKISLRAAVVQVTSKKPKTKEEILKEVQDIGYIFTGVDPKNSLNALLYTKDAFKRAGRKFSPA